MHLCPPPLREGLGVGVRRLIEGGTPTPGLSPGGGVDQVRRTIKFRISLISSIAKRMPSRPRPESFTPP